ncbi:hypothetical protein ACFQ1M_13225 [Sungkyunkwania multivorans]|uniref:Lipoprotein n=1 Tax=Sungkyunkwania multivorans TaxID=1173618 RepID=A0ABW3D059_9FLAO
MIRKTTFYALLICLSSCVTLRVNKPPEVENFYIANKKELKGLKLDKDRKAFVFENPGTEIDFKQFIAKKHGLENFKFSKTYTITENGANLNISVETPTVNEQSHTLDLLTPIISKAVSNENRRAEYSEDEKSYSFIAISVADDYGNDCLSTDSLFRNIAVDYLRSLKDEYLNTW